MRRGRLTRHRDAPAENKGLSGSQQERLPDSGCDLFRVACKRDLEGIVAKWTHGTYPTDTSRTSWLKIKNPEYSQIDGRAELFEASRGAQAPRTRLAPPALVLA